MERRNGGTRARLIAAAGELFAERGFRATTARDIAQRAGVNLAAANYYFGSKKELYLEVLRANFAQISAMLARRGGSRPAAEIDRLGRPAIVQMLVRRIQVMLEILIGPPPGQ
ncbi:MAG TPA: TetR family transcriptional regulator, partial [Candidatus Binatia bacterium]|nr:TetR family transcriptional regulator [Candidatus Binatia bacterium]